VHARPGTQNKDREDFSQDRNRVRAIAVQDARNALVQMCARSTSHRANVNRQHLILYRNTGTKAQLDRGAGGVERRHDAASQWMNAIGGALMASRL